MKTISKITLIGIISLFFFSDVSIFAVSESKTQGATKKERQLILDGNKLYKEKKFKEAKEKFQQALKENAESSVASFNTGLADIQIAASLQGQDSIAGQLLQEAASMMNKVGQRNVLNQNLSSRAFYNLGNIYFGSEQYGDAINAYKQSLRLNPSDNNARRNLRIAQKKKQEQDKDNNKQNNQQNQDNKDKQQDKKDNDKNNEKNQNQDQQKPRINNQTSQQILDAVERKENQTRMKRLGSQQSQRSRSNKPW